eukprot:6501333-Alexandrium_andersonii.AAC.1
MAAACPSSLEQVPQSVRPSEGFPCTTRYHHVRRLVQERNSELMPLRLLQKDREERRRVRPAELRPCHVDRWAPNQK